MKCAMCGQGTYTHGSAIYDYYSCGHAFEKPLNSKELGKWIIYKGPYNWGANRERITT